MSGIKITKNTLSKGLNEYTDVMYNRVSSTLRQAAKIVMDEAAENAPVDTKRLRNSLEQTGVTDKGLKQFKTPTGNGNYKFKKVRVSPKVDGQVFKGNEDTIGEQVITTSEQSITFGTKVPYSPFVELGTSRQEAQPFLSNAVSDKSNEVQKLIVKNLTV